MCQEKLTMKEFFKNPACELFSTQQWEDTKRPHTIFIFSYLLNFRREWYQIGELERNETGSSGPIL